MENHVLKSCYSAETIDQLMIKLPGRTKNAILIRASNLGLKKKEEPMHCTNPFAASKTIERLEAELNLAKAKNESEAAQQRFIIFTEQCHIAFTNALKSGTDATLASLFKQNAKEFAKLNGAISNTNRKLLEARIKLELA